jgi:hypothetical protein
MPRNSCGYQAYYKQMPPSPHTYQYPKVTPVGNNPKPGTPAAPKTPPAKQR